MRGHLQLAAGFMSGIVLQALMLLLVGFYPDHDSLIIRPAVNLVAVGVCAASGALDLARGLLLAAAAVAASLGLLAYSASIPIR